MNRPKRRVQSFVLRHYAFMPEEGAKARSLSNLSFEKLINAHGHDEIGKTVADESDHIRGINIMRSNNIDPLEWFALDLYVIFIHGSLKRLGMVPQNFP